MQGPAARVLVTAFAPVPGANHHASALAGMTQALHAEIDLVTVKTEELPHLERYGAARMFRVPVGMGGPTEQREAFVRAVLRQLEAQAYDVVHVCGPHEGAVAAAHRKDMGFRFVYEMASFPDEAEGRDTEAAWSEANETCLEAADLILIHTAAAERALAERGYAGKAAVVHPGVDINTFDWWPQGVSDAARLLFLGSFAADRDLHTLLGAVRAVSRKRPVTVLVAGEANVDRRERLRRLVDAFDVGEQVIVRGEARRAMLPMLIGAADLCVATASQTPRFQEFGDLPQPLLEYLACRRPVVAAGVPGVAEVLRDEQEGLLYTPGDENTLAEGIMTVLSDAPMRRRLIAAGYERVRAQFSDGARRRRIAEVYEMLVPGSQRYDAWTAGFSREVTGMVEVGSDVFEAIEGVDTSASNAAREVLGPATSPGSDSAHTLDTGDLLFVPRETEDDHPTPALPERAGADTNPALVAAYDSDLPEVPTAIKRHVEVTPTDARPAPESSEPPDTGPVRSPE